MDLSSKPFDIVRKMQMLRIAQHFDLPPDSEMFTLQVIYELNDAEKNTPPTISDIAGLLNVSLPTVSRCLQKLSAKGYIEKKASPRDRRGTYVLLTPLGLSVCRSCHSTMQDFVQKALSRVDPEELEQFFLTFDKVYEALRQELKDRETAASPICQ